MALPRFHTGEYARSNDQDAHEKKAEFVDWAVQPDHHKHENDSHDE